MTTITTNESYMPRPAAVTTATAGASLRDPRLDVARGIAMFIILVAHTPGNVWTLWIPARFGFSDATEIFVFCSGMASAIAFGRSFDSAGWTMGTARVGYRIWQIYWAHLCLFLALAAFLAGLDGSGWHDDKVYIGTLNLWKMFSEPGQQLVGLVTLTYVPNYFDVLPMYMVVLAMMPAVIALARLSLPLLAVASVTVWLFAQHALLEYFGLEQWHLSLPAEPWSNRTWFFNPFGWQLAFFTGFAFMRGWIPAPPVRAWLVGLALAVVLMSALVSSVGFRLFQTDLVKDIVVGLTGCTETGFGACNPIFDWRQAWKPWYDKSDFAILRYVHFLSLAYLAWVAVGAGGHRLIAKGEGLGARVLNEIVAVITKVGQQSLAVFVFSMFLARVNGWLLDVLDRTAFTWTLINVTGLGLLVTCAYTAAWFKSQPWRVKR